jgi:hypothetical protein
MPRFPAAFPAVLLLTAACASPLTRAAGEGRADEVRSLLPGEKGRCGQALNAAAAGDHEDVLKVLLDGGCDVDAKDSDGYTALMAAAARGHDGCVRLLLERKADPDLKSWNDNTAATLARKSRHKETVKLLEGFGLPALPEPVKAAAPRPAGASVEEVRAGRLMTSPRDYLGKLVLIRGRIQKVVAAGGKQYGFGLAEPGKARAGARGAPGDVALAGETVIGVASMAILVDEEGVKCAFIFRDGMAVPPAGQAASLAGRYLGDRLRTAAAPGSSALVPGVYLEAAKD